MTDKAPEQALETAKAEATARKLPDGSALVPLVTDDGTVEITVLAPPLWYEGAVEALTTGRITDWVKLAVDDPNSLARWNSVRKRYRDLEAFVAAFTKATGETPGESQGSSAS